METAKQKADDAIEKGYEHSDARWRELAFDAVHEICLTMETFTADDIRRITEKFQVQTHDTRAMGGVMRAAKTKGWCEPSGQFRTSDFTHGHLQHIWRSKIYKPKDTLF